MCVDAGGPHVWLVPESIDEHRCAHQIGQYGVHDLSVRMSRLMASTVYSARETPGVLCYARSRSEGGAG